MFWIFGQEAYGILAPQPGTTLTPTALKGEILTPRSPEKFLNYEFFLSSPPHTLYPQPKV